jgi:hypothetical protein
MTLSEVLPELANGKSVTRKSSTVDRMIRYDKKTKNFHEGIQGIPNVHIARRIEFTIDDLRAEDWVIVNDGD